MDDGGRLAIRPVQIAFRGPENVYVAEGLADGEQLVVTDIAAPVPGMPLRVAGTEGQGPQEDTQMVREKGGP